MLSHSFFFVLFYLVSMFQNTIARNDPVPFLVATSSRHYGPDGPWQAVSVSYGFPGQNIDLYPGRTFETIILTDSVCKGVSLTPCGSGGLFNPDDSPGLDDSSIQYSDHNEGFGIDWTLGALRVGGDAHFALDQLTVHGQSDHAIANLSTRLIYNASIIYPDGTEYPPQLGQLSLGSSSATQQFSLGPDVPPIEGNLIPGYLWETDVIPSSSFGLHIGSAALGPPLCLWIGGYDPSRALGFVASLLIGDQLNYFQIDLLDIGIGVDHGGSPFSYSRREGVLAEGNSSMANALAITMNPGAPYLALPKSTCAAIAKDLPVNFNAKYGLYFWDVDDPQYVRIVTSPSYLSFIFRASSTSNANLTVKVPFQLLNLTLEAPLIDKATPYFPCQPPQLGDGFSLGRAFLQAAFLGANWNKGLGKWFLAQAPGPNTGSIPSTAPYPETFTDASSSSNKWSDTWSGHWTPLPETTKSSVPKPTAFGNPEPSETVRKDTATGAMTTGAKIGIGTSSAALVVIVTGTFYILRRHRAQRVIAPLPALDQTGFKDKPKPDGLNFIHEAEGWRPPELYSRGDIVHELHGDQTV